jgi:hypothetical protein
LKKEKEPKRKNGGGLWKLTRCGNLTKQDSHNACKTLLGFAQFSQGPAAVINSKP